MICHGTREQVANYRPQKKSRVIFSSQKKNEKNRKPIEQDRTPRIIWPHSTFPHQWSTKCPNGCMHAWSILREKVDRGIQLEVRAMDGTSARAVTRFLIPTGRTEPAGPVPVYRSGSVGNR
jgi:hypothetical protein